MKKFLTILYATTFLAISSAYAKIVETTVYAPPIARINPLYASPISSGQINNPAIIVEGMIPPVEYKIQTTLSDEDTTVYIGYANGMFYANGVLLGTFYKTSNRFGKTLLNGIELKKYSFGRTSSSGDFGPKTQTDPLYFKAHTKFVLGDFQGSVTDCAELLKRDPGNLQAFMMQMIAQSVLAKKTTPQDAQVKIEKIFKGLES